MEPAAATPGQASSSGGGGPAGRPPLHNVVLGSGTTSVVHLDAITDRPASNRYNDRFIPDRSTVDFDLADYLLIEKKKQEDHTTVISPQKEAYRKHLADCLFRGRDRVFGLKSKQSVPSIFEEVCTDRNPSTRKLRYIPQSPDKAFDAPDLMDDYYLNLLDWGSGNVLAMALGNIVDLVDPSDGSIPAYIMMNGERGPVTSVSWAPDGQRLAIGLYNSDVLVWDTNSLRELRTLRRCHQSGVGSLSWNNDILTTGGFDGKIVLNDVRMKSHILRTYRGHQQEVCGLKWSGSGQRLASGGSDNRLCIWDSLYSPMRNQWLYRFEDHKAAVKALAWCPFQGSLLASGGGTNDRCIKFWDINLGACLNSVDTGSQVCALLWNKNEKELLSSHGFTQNQLSLWRYPSMIRMAELKGHRSRVLFMAQSPNGCTVASAAANDSLLLWNVFGDPKTQKPSKRMNAGPFSDFHCTVR